METMAPVDLDIPALANDGVHIFQDVLAVGQNVSSGTAPAGGTGPVLTIEAGTTLAFSDTSDYLVVNRGSQIIADGTAANPIILTSETDAVLRTVLPDAVQQWGGIVINGNGITNNCTDAQRASNSCHVESEGQPVYYGGNDNSESSGVLRYVVVKHTGSEVAPDDELNGITFNAVGSGTTVSHIETYSTYDDGIEFFGGAVDVDPVVRRDVVAPGPAEGAEGLAGGGEVRRALVGRAGRGEHDRVGGAAVQQVVDEGDLFLLRRLGGVEHHAQPVLLTGLG